MEVRLLSVTYILYGLFLRRGHNMGLVMMTMTMTMKIMLLLLLLIITTLKGEMNVIKQTNMNIAKGRRS